MKTRDEAKNPIRTRINTILSKKKKKIVCTGNKIAKPMDDNRKKKIAKIRSGINEILQIKKKAKTFSIKLKLIVKIMS